MSAAEEIIARVAARTMRWNFRLWGFGEGVALRGLLAADQATGGGQYLGFVEALLRAYLGRGVARSNEDHVAPGAELLEFYGQTGEAEFLEAARSLAALHAAFPVNRFGARMHRPDMPGWRRQIWVDSMDVDAPFLARLAAATGDGRYLTQAEGEIVGYARALQDEATGLFWHGFEEDCGQNGQLWARGQGWALMGLVATLKLLPQSEACVPELGERLRGQCRALAGRQRADGLWHTVVDRPETYAESTLAVMAAWALREAFGAGLLDETEFGGMERAARAAALRLVGGDGALGLVSEATPVGELKMYATRRFGLFPWGQGPLLMMLAQRPADDTDWADHHG
jgi:unsaturated rhamnogalacturonyl hydrolase